MTNEQLFRCCFTFILVAMFSVSIYFRYRARQSGDVIPRVREGSMVLLARILFATALYVPFLSYLANPTWMGWSALALSNWLRWLGVAIGIAMVPMVYWVMISIGTNVSETFLTKQNHELVTHGPYRWIRHPLYTVASIGFTCLAVVASNWFMLAMALVALSGMALWIVPREEAELVEKFSDEYRSYQQRTGRFIPRLRMPS